MKPVVCTYYGSYKGNKGFWPIKFEEQQKAFDQLATLVHFRDANRSVEALAALKGYELGTRRSLQDYITLTGVDTINHKLNAQASCAVKRWQAWSEQSQPPYAMLQGSPARLGIGFLPRPDDEAEAALHIGNWSKAKPTVPSHRLRHSSMIPPR